MPLRFWASTNITGSLEKGKDANIVVSEGDLLDMKTSIMTQALYRAGKLIWITNRFRVV